MSQFNRSASLIIGEKGESGVKIKDLRISFSIKKTKEKDPNIAEIAVYNLSQITRDKIKKKQKIFLSAGYLDDEGESIIFIGDITEVKHSLTPPEIVTQITAQDGQTALADTKIKMSLKNGASSKNILKDILDKFPLSNDLKNLIFDDKKYQSGLSFIGPAREILDKVTKFNGLEWSVQNNEVKIVKAGESDGRRAVFLSSENGMIGSPERFTDDSEKSKGASKTVINGWKIKSLLQPKINPKNRISVKSKEIPDNSFFTVLTVTHNGDNFEGAWDTMIEVQDD